VRLASSLFCRVFFVEIDGFAELRVQPGFESRHFRSYHIALFLQFGKFNAEKLSFGLDRQFGLVARYIEEHLAHAQFDCIFVECRIEQIDRVLVILQLIFLVLRLSSISESRLLSLPNVLMDF